MSTPELIDTHAHLDMAHFSGNLDEVVARARDAEVKRIICNGIDPSSSREAIQLAHQYHEVFAAVGIHPEEARRTTRQDIEDIAILAKDSRVVAIGEIGLDFYRDYGPREKQLEVFQWQLDLARRLDMPVVIHSRQADDALVPLLSTWQKEHRAACPGVIHCYNGSVENARAYIDLGFYISFGCYIGYPPAKAARMVVEQLPIERLLLETDSPFLPPQSHRGERNEPAYVVEAANELARLKGLGAEEVARVTTTNAERVFAGLK